MGPRRAPPGGRQESLAAKFLESWPRFRWDGTLRHAGGWVAGIAKSLAFNERRKFATHRRHLARLAAGETSGYANPPKGRPKRQRKPTPSHFTNETHPSPGHSTGLLRALFACYLPTLPTAIPPSRQREELGEVCSQRIDSRAGSFQAQGTNVNTAIVVLDN